MHTETEESSCRVAPVSASHVFALSHSGKHWFNTKTMKVLTESSDSSNLKYLSATQIFFTHLQHCFLLKTKLVPWKYTCLCYLKILIITTWINSNVNGNSHNFINRFKICYCAANSINLDPDVQKCLWGFC